MKRIFLVCAFACMFAAFASSQQKQAVIVVSDSSLYDFGDVKEADGPVTHVFKVKNSGDAPLVITKVTASCGCTTPDWTKEPIAPGKTGEVKATFDVNGRVGPFTKTISVFSNGSSGSYVLTIKGNVIGKQ
ncbi:MAG: DUF1573 domain-containing protein [Tannerella sp.]|nr:DUF1573 domain-containing protein [Tannerella sp.]